MGQATLGFAGGPGVAFRIDPESIDWNWSVITNVIDTIGGRVIQILGAYLDNLTITGSLGQDHSTAEGVSWRQAEAFLKIVTRIMNHQSADSRQQDLMHPPAIFSYPPKNWRFRCYVMGLEDADGGGSIVLSPGKFNQRYTLTLFIVSEGSDALVKAGESNGVINKKAEEAVAAYMARISDGIGWHFSQFNGHTVATPSGKSKKTTSKSVFPATGTALIHPLTGGGGSTGGSRGPGGQGPRTG